MVWLKISLKIHGDKIMKKTIEIDVVPVRMNIMAELEASNKAVQSWEADIVEALEKLGFLNVKVRMTV